MDDGFSEMRSDRDDVHLPGRTMSALVSENGLEDADGKSFWVVSKVCVCACVCVRMYGGRVYVFTYTRLSVPQIIRYTFQGPALQSSP